MNRNERISSTGLGIARSVLFLQVVRNELCGPVVQEKFSESGRCGPAGMRGHANQVAGAGLVEREQVSGHHWVKLQ